tara:strand:- start:4144 stop:4635 length:492 start_codon:yes stop_codon:yes gene_type:complete
MPTTDIFLPVPINKSVQVGDVVYYIPIVEGQVGGFTTHLNADNVLPVGHITEIVYIDSVTGDDQVSGLINQLGEFNEVVIADSPGNFTSTSDIASIPPNYDTVKIVCELEGTEPNIGDFILFGKDRSVNESSLIGYYGKLKMKNDSKQRAELYAVTCEMTGNS